MVEMTKIKMHEYALLEDARDPSNTKYIYAHSLPPWYCSSLSLSQEKKSKDIQQN